MAFVFSTSCPTTSQAEAPDDRRQSSSAAFHFEWIELSSYQAATYCMFNLSTNVLFCPYYNCKVLPWRAKTRKRGSKVIHWHHQSQCSRVCRISGNRDGNLCLLSESKVSLKEYKGLPVTSLWACMVRHSACLKQVFAKYGRQIKCSYSHNYITIFWVIPKEISKVLSHHATMLRKLSRKGIHFKNVEACIQIRFLSNCNAKMVMVQLLCSFLWYMQDVVNSSILSS